ncbi:sensor histidine kinase [Luteimonas abyssi]|uniref:sensor histidine kinase n=1 Tax=Luteimonas abyssi TaxID=1247514 RepID=UPI000B2C4017|nr:ATP-binding protein [Luteimonas abyssi]
MKDRRSRPDVGLGAPVVVTVDAHGEVLDIVGDLERFCDEAGGQAQTIQRLLDLLVGDGDPPDIVPALEIAENRFVDIHIVAEDETRHFVLLDASDLMRTLRHRQQVGYDVALERDRTRRRLPATHQMSAATMPRYQGMSALAAVIGDMRGPLVEVLGQARVLESGVGSDETLLHSIAAIRHAAIRLDAMCMNGLIAFGDPSTVRSDIFDTQSIAAFIQDTFQLQARMQGVVLDVRAPAPPVRVTLDDIALRLVLINLIVRALEGLSSGTLVVTLSPDAVRRHLDIEIGCEPGGFDEDCFGELITAATPGAHLGLAISRAVLMQMHGRLELVERQDGGFEIWFRLPFGASVPIAGAS